MIGEDRYGAVTPAGIVVDRGHIEIFEPQRPEGFGSPPKCCADLGRLRRDLAHLWDLRLKAGSWNQSMLDVMCERLGFPKARQFAGDPIKDNSFDVVT